MSILFHKPSQSTPRLCVSFRVESQLGDVNFLTMKQGDISSRRPCLKWRTKYLLWEVGNSPIWKMKTCHRDLGYREVLKTETSSPRSFSYSSPIDMNGLPSELSLDPRGNAIGYGELEESRTELKGLASRLSCTEKVVL